MPRVSETGLHNIKRLCWCRARATCHYKRCFGILHKILTQLSCAGESDFLNIPSSTQQFAGMDARKSPIRAWMASRGDCVRSALPCRNILENPFDETDTREFFAICPFAPLILHTYLRLHPQQFLIFLQNRIHNLLQELLHLQRRAPHIVRRLHSLLQIFQTHVERRIRRDQL